MTWRAAPVVKHQQIDTNTAQLYVAYVWNVWLLFVDAFDEVTYLRNSLVIYLSGFQFSISSVNCIAIFWATAKVSQIYHVGILIFAILYKFSNFSRRQSERVNVKRTYQYVIWTVGTASYTAHETHLMHEQQHTLHTRHSWCMNSNTASYTSTWHTRHVTLRKTSNSTTPFRSASPI